MVAATSRESLPCPDSYYNSRESKGLGIPREPPRTLRRESRILHEAYMLPRLSTINTDDMPLHPCHEPREA